MFVLNVLFHLAVHVSMSIGKYDKR